MAAAPLGDNGHGAANRHALRRRRASTVTPARSTAADTAPNLMRSTASARALRIAGAAPAHAQLRFGSSILACAAPDPWRYDWTVARCR
ncbi:MAG: hypothetical protein HS111_23720 [Kofleriaceae bacterium]|nr:hypothetical protein [Kofleriaceae bacterium]